MLVTPYVLIALKNKHLELMGTKRTKGKPVIHNELKRTRAIALTDTAIELLDQKSTEANVSRSELVEQFARGSYENPELKNLREKVRQIELTIELCVIDIHAKKTSPRWQNLWKFLERLAETAGIDLEVLSRDE